jgi:short-subunit dehydrogenase
MKSAKRAIITGASSGIGLATAIRLAQSGWELILLGRDREKLQEIRTNLSPYTIVETVVVDLNIPNEIDLFLNRFLTAEKPVSLLINCAGIGFSKAFENIALDEWNKTFSTNVTAPFLLSRGIVRHWSGNEQKGMIIHIGSIFSLMACSGYAPYIASKHALNGLAKAMLKELRRKGHEVHILYPGSVKTDFHRRGGMIRDPRFQLAADDVAAYIAAIANHNQLHTLFPVWLTLKRIQYFVFGHPHLEDEKE